MGGSRVILSSLEETGLYAKTIADELKPNMLLLLTGGLGSGKTTFTQQLVRALGADELVQSPTFVYLQIYEGRLPIFHFDLYRMRGKSDFLAMGFEEYFSQGGVCVIEWPERIADLLPASALHIDLQILSETKRAATRSQWGSR